MQKLLIVLGLVLSGSFLSTSYAETPAVSFNKQCTFSVAETGSMNKTDFRPKKKKAKKRKGGHKCEAYR